MQQGLNIKRIKGDEEHVLVHKTRTAISRIQYSCLLGIKNNTLKITFIPRSTEGMLFYLGEIVNAYRGWASTETSESEEFSGNFCSGNSRALCVGKTDKLQPIFLTLEHDQLTRHFLSRKITNKQGATGVEFNGKYRYVPKKDKCGDRTSEGSCIKTRSMQVLSLLTQLFGLNNNSPNLPAARLIDVRGI